ncbi:F-box/LRR-repeat protein 12 [Phalaenopsis equestris]|uniref:F-box/LRR-repeat protein 12 n=1 Tax=Phalaenopsis equestris TaxID=78828 RepID=UPI0009E391DC|nr:F-box/LRR-repeat protein 12 [Phalaenopsis equestris]XP_020593508.1 F-box/LRR-repeat protein 12 [Phalaenopsis equestris]XP_020593510.1 F-box/LRR-repeat protein 12 [Phalaenopsis equestris]XP_020593511.1 F-box/LRR-repeat protein 12 [Phalaenopsis equestris]XP_020593512.1 F-box/LRR-repeat protein 12 [Phalaenopsis equestris]XP_020593513.1 F-box/LRR-repeat protein 12 [Phalaenopsis equestris]
MTLSDDCLISIFQKLQSRHDRNAFGLTCRHWHHIQNISRRSLNLHFSYETTTYQSYVRYLPALLNRFSHLSSISIAGCTELPDSALFGLKNLKISLRSLSLSCCFKITDDGLAHVAMHCSRLVSLTLYRCTITDLALQNIANFCKLLENLNLSYCTDITDRGICALSTGCRLLHVLVLSCCSYVTGSGLKGCSQTLEYIEAECCMFTNEGLLQAVSGGGLKYLNLSNSRCSMNIDVLAPMLVSRLRFLNLRLCRFISNESVVTISKSCPLLEEWSVAVCHEIGVLGWEAIGLNCCGLKVLHVNRCRNLCDRGLQSLREGCGRLGVLYMNGCNGVSPLGVELFRLRRQDVEIRSEELLSIGPGIFDFFV